MYCPFKTINGGKDQNCTKERCEWYDEESKKCAVLKISIALEKIYYEINDKTPV